VRYVLSALAGGVLGVAGTLALLPDQTPIDAGWGYAWLGLGLGALAGVIALKLFKRRSPAPGTR
jgi:hypothetical protein